MLSATLASCTSFAENPAISKKYSDKEIADFIQNYETANSVTGDGNSAEKAARRRDSEIGQT